MYCIEGNASLNLQNEDINTSDFYYRDKFYFALMSNESCRGCEIIIFVSISNQVGT